MSFILSSLIAYFGVHAGVFLGSLAAEELPLGRYRLRIVQLMLLLILSCTLIYQIIALQDWLSILFVVLIVVVDLLFLFERRIPLIYTHPGSRTLATYGLFAIIVVLAAPQLQLFLAVLVFLYGLVTGSLIAEPFVEDRKLHPWKAPYHLAIKTTWTYPIVWAILVLVLLLF